MTKKKTQKVRFHKGDRRPGSLEEELKYIKKLTKKGRKILWQVVEQPSNLILRTCFFEEDADKLCKFHNKHKLWIVSGGIPSFLSQGKLPIK
jgi:hypothetical protein|tara:strand:- start:97 stop:372 length:276 start_codon:yes stop_codon:yes gene_type:complete